jgi:preprotein translocase SecE subunit
MGKQFLGFLVEARTEVRKVVWPTRQETVQSTLVVVALVFLVGLLLWTLDAALYCGDKCNDWAREIISCHSAGMLFMPIQTSRTR